MTQEKIRNFYAREIEWSRRDIEFDNHQIEWLTKQIKREKESIQNLREYVWSKGVLTDIEMKIWGDDKYETPEAKNYKNERNRYYKRRQKDIANLKKYERLLAEMQ